VYSTNSRKYRPSFATLAGSLRRLRLRASTPPLRVACAILRRQRNLIYPANTLHINQFPALQTNCWFQVRRNREG
jgi:hypothetical protein